MRAEIRERLAEKITPNVPKPELGDLLDQIEGHSAPVSFPVPPDTRCWLLLTTPTGEARIQIPENVACNYRARYGKAPNFEPWLLARIRDLLNAS